MDQRRGVTRGTPAARFHHPHPTLTHLGSLLIAGLVAVPLGCARSPSAPEGAAKPAEPALAPSSAPGAGRSTVSPEPQLQAELHVPALPAGQKAPLLLMLHGLGASARDIETGSDWFAFAREHGIAWLAPSGPFDKSGRRFWDAGPSCCNFERPPIDHVAELSALLERTTANPSIDRTRVFVGGHSNGAFMAHRLACERPDLVRGVMAHSGTGPLDPGACKSPGPLRVLQIHGGADPIVPYTGGHLFQNPSLPKHLSATETTHNWAGLLGCSQTPVSLPSIDLEASIPGAETRVQEYPRCRAGAVELWTVTRGSHLVGFRSPAPAAIWAFMSR